MPSIVYGAPSPSCTQRRPSKRQRHRGQHPCLAMACCCRLVSAPRALPTPPFRAARLQRTRPRRASEYSQPDASLLAYVHHVSLMKKAQERFAAMLEACDAPTVYNVWRRM